MGYANTLPFQYIEIYSQAKYGYIDGTTTPTDFVINDIVIPTFSQPLSFAYLDLIAYKWLDTAAAVGNYANGGVFGAHMHGGTFRTSYSFSNFEFYTNPSEVVNNAYMIPGTNNVAPYIESGETYSCQLHSFRTFANDLFFYGVLCRLRMYFGVV
jgi:hypothetical protein